MCYQYGAAFSDLPLLYSTGNSISLGYWPYLEGELWRDVTVKKFNETATKVVDENNMHVVDLYSCISDLVMERNEWNVYEDGVHFIEEIKAKQGEFLAQRILQIIGETSVEEVSVQN